jgi:hypothetical protein
MSRQKHEPHDVPDPLPAGPPVAVSDDYEAFGLWMNVQLSQLVARWNHLASPNARRVEQKQERRFSLPRKAK